MNFLEQFANIDLDGVSDLAKNVSLIRLGGGNQDETIECKKFEKKQVKEN